MTNKPPILERRRAEQNTQPIVRYGFGPGATIGVPASKYCPGFDLRRHVIEEEPVKRFGFGEEPVRAVRYVGSTGDLNLN